MNFIDFNSGNNTACYLLGPECNSSCHSLYSACTGISNGLDTGMMPLYISLYAAGAVLVISGTKHAVFLAKQISEKCCRKPMVIDYDNPNLELDPSHWSYRALHPSDSPKPKSVWENLFGTVRDYAFGAVPIVTGVILQRIPGIIMEQACQPIGASCPDMSGHCVSACEWGNDWLIDVIKQLIK